MKKHFLKKHEENWLRIPYEENADPCIITISDSVGVDLEDCPPVLE